MIRNFTGRPVRIGTPVPGTVSRASTKSLQADWIDQQIVFTINDSVIVNAQVADFMELIGIKLDAEVWSPGFVKTDGGVAYAPAPIRHKNLTRKRE
jgi:hypothetical protein